MYKPQNYIVLKVDNLFIFKYVYNHVCGMQELKFIDFVFQKIPRVQQVEEKKRVKTGHLLEYK